MVEIVLGNISLSKIVIIIYITKNKNRFLNEIKTYYKASFHFVIFFFNKGLKFLFIFLLLFSLKIAGFFHEYFLIVLLTNLSSDVFIMNF